jgi:hypothetical protein
MEKRIVKIPMPVELIAKMDEALASSRGGFQTREQFFREATEGLLADISYEESPDGSGGTGVTQAQPARPEPAAGIEQTIELVPAWEREELQLVDLAGSGLGPPHPGVDLSVGVADPEQEPLLGLHNRDYPSLWAAGRLARYTTEDVIPFEDFRRRATLAAWYYGAQLSSIANDGGPRLTALFPTNPRKPESAERAFENFAIGSVPRRLSVTGPVKAMGPLFVWRLCQLQRKGDKLVVAMTPAGRNLLEKLVGISLRLPHDPEMSARFLQHVFDHSPGDRWGFEQVLEVVKEEPDRGEVVAAFAGARPEWTAATASSVAQGYVARAREWGLLEPRLQNGRYRLTLLGEKWQAYQPKEIAKERETQR